MSRAAAVYTALVAQSTGNDQDNHLGRLLLRLLSSPTPDDLRRLQIALLSAREDPDRTEAADRALRVAGELHSYLCELESKLSAREYSNLASMLDIGAVGAVAAENLVDPERRKPLQVALAALSEGLMVLASRQYVKAWERETMPLATQAAWVARQELWYAAGGGGTAGADETRAAQIDALLAPVFAPETAPEARHAIVGRLLQLLVVGLAARALSDGSTPTPTDD